MSPVIIAYIAFVIVLALAWIPFLSPHLFKINYNSSNFKVSKIFITFISLCWLSFAIFISFQVSKKIVIEHKNNLQKIQSKAELLRMDKELFESWMSGKTSQATIDEFKAELEIKKSQSKLEIDKLNKEMSDLPFFLTYMWNVPHAVLVFFFLISLSRSMIFYRKRKENTIKEFGLEEFFKNYKWLNKNKSISFPYSVVKNKNSNSEYTFRELTLNDEGFSWRPEGEKEEIFISIKDVNLSFSTKLNNKVYEKIITPTDFKNKYNTIINKLEEFNQVMSEHLTETENLKAKKTKELSCDPIDDMILRDKNKNLQEKLNMLPEETREKFKSAVEKQGQLLELNERL